MAHAGWVRSPAEVLRVRPGFDLAAVDTRATPGWEGGRSAAEAVQAECGERLSVLQETLYAHGRSGGTRSVLLVLQGMDTAGKGGIVRHVLGMVDPQGVEVRSFGVPTAEEAAQHFLGRIRAALPGPGRIGVFDRSHYEDVLVVRVAELVAPDVWQARFSEIRAFEEEVTAAGTLIVKVLLAISPTEQRDRLRSRLRRPEKHWKYDPADIDARAQWPAYEEAYAEVLARTSTDDAPWFVVPADRKWYARLAVTELLVHRLEGLGLGWPVVDIDVDAELARLDATVPEADGP